MSRPRSLGLKLRELVRLRWRLRSGHLSIPFPSAPTTLDSSLSCHIEQHVLTTMSGPPPVLTVSFKRPSSAPAVAGPAHSD